MKITRAVSVLLTGLVVAGCSAGEPDGQGAGQEPPTVENLTVRTGADIRLPLDSYRLTAEQINQFAKASELLAADCMKRYGFTWEVYGGDVAAVKDAPQAERYGLISADSAARYGYHPTPDTAAEDTGRSFKRKVEPTPEMLMVYGAKGAKTDADWKGAAIPEGGCLGEAERKLEDGAPDSYVGGEVQNIKNEVFAQVESDPRLKKAMDAWSSCMKSSGYDYKNIWDANNDTRWQQGSAASPTEIATATADVECKFKSKLPSVYLSLETAYENQRIDSNAEEMSAFKAGVETRMKNAADILAKNPA
ncbi:MULTISPECIES: hypothetical protein [Streptomyces]|uniref:Lipoprotein n=2 Tax=Streptomyces TaxID=1883 RepID=A0ABU2RTG9_9ACTN|nr:MULTISPECIES: hypothetical protein [unclassified Streptomyces]MBK3594212.1 hypothetical protein [Streptomyces sp. MBT51]MDT0431805.1 hypothetical protein [Streptomyces sp. DSM 41770]